MKEIQERVGGGPVTVEGDTFRQNTFSNICLYMDSAHKTTQGIFNFHFCLFVKWASAHIGDAEPSLGGRQQVFLTALDQPPGLKIGDYSGFAQRL